MFPTLEERPTANIIYRHPRRRRGLALAALGSLGVHVVVGALAAPALVTSRPALARQDVVEVVPMPAAMAPPEARPEPPQDRSKARRRPRVASTIRPTRPIDDRRGILPDPPLSEEPAMGPPEETPPTDPPRVPSPREAALRDVVVHTPLPPSPEEELETRLDGMLAGALRPLPSDRSPMPELRPDAAGNLVYRHGGLLAKIRPDGSVIFAERHGASVEGFERGEDPITDLHTRIPGVPMTSFKAPPASCARPGPPTDSAGLGVTVRPNFDLNDLAAWAVGDDPLAAQKRWFLRQTEPLRDGLAVKARARDTALAPAMAARRATAVWTNGSLSAATRRRLLFELWDECEEATGPEDDRPEVEAGVRARRQIEAFVRRRIPVGSDDAYSTSELDRLNARRESRRPFRPYR